MGLDKPLNAWPENYIGAVTVHLPRFFGLTYREVRIGIELSQPCDFVAQSHDEFECRFVLDVFVDPPTVSSCDFAIATVRRSTRSIAIRAESGRVEVRGTLSDDLLTIKGVADIRNFQLLDVAGEFLGCQILLEAYESDED